MGVLSWVMIAFFVLLFLGIPVAHVVLGASALGVLLSGISPSILAQQIFMGINSYTLTAVPFFIISGNIAAGGDTSQKLVDTINAFLGHIRGGLGIATIFTCALFGAITGSAIATVVAIGTLMLPKMIEAGYPKKLSLGIITVAGTLGVMIPPSIPMLQIAVVMNVPVSEQFAAGFIPGLLSAVIMSIYVFFAAKKYDIPLQPRMAWRERLRVVKNSFWALLYPVIILGCIYGGLATPTETAVISLFYVLFIELAIYKKIRILDLSRNMQASIVNSATLTLTMATAQNFVWYLTKMKVPAMVYKLITEHISSATMLWVLLCVIFFIVGCFTNVGVVVIILGPMLMQVLGFYDINLIHFIIVVVLMSQIGFVTPPFGLCLFVSMKLGKASMQETTAGSMPLLIALMLATVIIVAIPGISTFLPNFLFH